MDGNPNFKYYAVFALLISIICLSLGFAAYSSSLQIKAEAGVHYINPVSQSVAFSTYASHIVDGPVVASVSGGASADNAQLVDNEIRDINVHFTQPAQAATFTFYAINPSSFTYYLNSVVFGTKSCSPYSNPNNPNPGSASYVANACNDIVMIISVGEDDFVETENNIVGKSLASSSYKPIVVTVEYIGGGALADGDFTVSFGTSSLTYSTVD